MFIENCDGSRCNDCTKCNTQGNLVYAGIGSRSTPIEILGNMTELGRLLAEQHFILRSGHADGADNAFENGCDISNGKKEIYLPWKGFNKAENGIYNIPDEAYEIAKRFHPAWDRLSEPAKKLMARNSCQVLGKDLKTPCNFVICYTPNGKKTGGTRQAIDIAEYCHIPVLNLGAYRVNEFWDRVEEFFSTLNMK